MISAEKIEKTAALLGGNLSNRQIAGIVAIDDKTVAMIKRKYNSTGIKKVNLGVQLEGDCLKRYKEMKRFRDNYHDSNFIELPSCHPLYKENM